MVDYIQQYSGTDAESVIDCPFSELLNGKVYKTGQRQGAALFNLRITLVHDTNLDKLYRFLDYAELMDEEGNPIDLSVHMIEAEDVYEIEEIVSIFNESQDNYW